MPLILHQHINNSTQIGVWHIEEPLEWFETQFTISDTEAAEIVVLTSRKKIEWYACRWLLNLLLGNAKRQECSKDEFGKPFLVNSNLEISISHSADKAAVIISTLPVGIDVQYFTEKILRIEQRFMREIEQQSLSIPFKFEHLHTYWGAKESLYKAYGKRQLDFRKNIMVSPFEYEKLGGKAKGQVIKENFCAFYDIYYQTLEGFSLTYCVLAPTPSNS
jgi:4'-phosphopantetheinyl transferase